MQMSCTAWQMQMSSSSDLLKQPSAQLVSSSSSSVKPSALSVTSGILSMPFEMEQLSISASPFLSSSVSMSLIMRLKSGGLVGKGLSSSVLLNSPLQIGDWAISSTMHAITVMTYLLRLQM